MLSDIQIGGRFRWRDPSTDRRGAGVITVIRSSKQEHMGPEVSDYASLWIEVRGESGDLNGFPLTILLATDGRAYLDGKPIEIEPVR